jgi:general nucleoside transport system permease protein
VSQKTRLLVVSVLAPILAFVVSLLIATIVIKISGNDPFFAYSKMWHYDTRSDSITSILNRASSLYLAGIAVALGFKMNLFNIGVEGQYRVAGLFAAYLGAQVSAPPVIHVTFIIAVAMIVGAAYAAT